MTRKYFGTDGIRGLVNSFPMTPEIALKVGMAIGAKFIDGKHRHRVVIGKDTRLSGYIIENSLTAGLAAVGMDVFLVGPMPTPAVSMLTKSIRADIGIMISASHNPYHDNGIKIFQKDGYKLSDKIEQEIEVLIDGNIAKYLAPAGDLGRVKRLDDAGNRYIEHVKRSFPKDKNLTKLKVVIDCANGAAYNIAPKILWELGAEVISISINPDGFNINQECGSTRPEKLAKKVVDEGADIGIALDGDADRLVIVDEKGQVVPGDKVIAVIAQMLHDQGNLDHDIAVITQMSNLALENYLSYIGVSAIRTKVGDRYVLEEMRNSGYNFGAEQSGHIVLSDYSTTGDGMVAALQILSLICDGNKKASELFDLFELMPQILRNVNFNVDPFLDQDFVNFIEKKKAEIAGTGRILVRKSGTENLIRIMVEGQDEKSINQIAELIEEKIKNLQK